MSEKNYQKRAYGKGALLAILLVVVSTPGLAKTRLSSTPIKEDNYETPHQGVLHVEATVFSAPCNLVPFTASAKHILLIGCGAGDAFAPQTAIFPRMVTPAKLQFIDTQNHDVYPPRSVSLQNGRNAVALPEGVKHKQTLRLEVDYE